MSGSTCSNAFIASMAVASPELVSVWRSPPPWPRFTGHGWSGGFPTAVWFLSPEQLAAFNRNYTNRNPISRADWIMIAAVSSVSSRVPTRSMP